MPGNRSARLVAPQSRFLRFLASGAVNTALTYILYLVCLQFLSYRVSYTVAYAAGIILAYVLNRVFVFKAHRGALSFASLPAIYLVQYLLGIGLLWLWVEVAGLRAECGPLVVVAISVPLTYLLTRMAFVGK